MEWTTDEMEEQTIKRRLESLLCENLIRVAKRGSISEKGREWLEQYLGRFSEQEQKLAWESVKA